MSEKVISGGWVIPGAIEVQVPSMSDFYKLRQKIDEINDDKLTIWQILDQLKATPPSGTNTDYQREVRAVREAAISAREQINGPRPNGELTIWERIGGHDDRILNAENRLDSVEKQLMDLPDKVKDVLREVFREKLDPLLEPAGRNIGAILEDNRKLREELAALRKEIDELKNR